MSSESPHWQHLADVVNARMEKLDLTNETLADAGGPSTTTTSKIRNAVATSISDATLRKLDIGLRWRKPSARAALQLGQQPVELPAAWDLGDMLTEVERSNLTTETKAVVLRLLKGNEERGAAG